jgi:hypothetical protein
MFERFAGHRGAGGQLPMRLRVATQFIVPTLFAHASGPADHPSYSLLGLFACLVVGVLGIGFGRVGWPGFTLRLAPPARATSTPD